MFFDKLTDNKNFSGDITSNYTLRLKKKYEISTRQVEKNSWGAA